MRTLASAVSKQDWNEAHLQPGCQDLVGGIMSKKCRPLAVSELEATRASSTQGLPCMNTVPGERPSRPPDWHRKTQQVSKIN